MALRALTSSLAAWLARRFPRAGVLGIGFFVGVTVLVGAAWIFGVLAEDVADGDAITRLDIIVGRWLVVHQPAWLTQVALLASRIHDTGPVAAYISVIAVYLLLRRQMASLRWLLLTVPTGMLVNFLEKLAFHRARPDFRNVVEAVVTYSFPSGHTTAATLLYGWLALYLTRRMAWRPRAFACAAAAVLALIVAFSRMALGVHFLTDVLAAMAGATAWVALVWSAMNWRGAK